MTLTTYQDLRAKADEVGAQVAEPQRTLIKVGVATCSRVVGAEETLEALRREAAARGLEADVMVTGCLGLCYAEPLVEVQRPGAPAVLYQQVAADRIPALLDGVGGG